MITLKEWMEVVNYRITEGSEYYGFNEVTYALSSWNGDQDGHSLEIIFDPKTQIVYQVQVCDYRCQRAYRLTNPDTPEVRPNAEAWDDVNWIDLEEDDDWIQKALAIVAGEDYDTRISVPLELEDDVLLALMKKAHECDLTFNEFVEEALLNLMKEFKNNPASTRAGAQQWLEDHDAT